MKISTPFLSAVLLAFILLSVPAMAITIKSMKTVPYDGQTDVSGDYCGLGTYNNGTWTPGMGCTRNLTFTFNMSAAGFKGKILPAFSVYRLYTTGWTISTSFANSFCAVAEVTANASRAPIVSYNDSQYSASNATHSSGPATLKCVPHTDSGGNGTRWDFPSGMPMTQDYLTFAIAPQNGSTGHEINWAPAGGGAYHIVWANLTFDENATTDITESPANASLMGYWPLDQDPSPSFTEANLMNFLDKSRSSGETGYTTVKNNGVVRVLKGYRPGRTWLATWFNSSGASFPNIRAFLQVNESFWVSDYVAPYSNVFVTGNHFDNKWVSNPWDGSHWFAKFDIAEIWSDAAATRPIDCTVLTQANPFTTSGKLYSVCGMPAGTIGGEYVTLWEGTSILVNLTNSSDPYLENALEIAVDLSKSHKLQIFTAERGEFNVTQIGNYAGTFQSIAMQARGASTALFSASTYANKLRGKSARLYTSAMDAYDYSTREAISTNITVSSSQVDLSSFAAMRGAIVKPVVISTQYIGTWSQFFGLQVGEQDMQAGTVHLYVPVNLQDGAYVNCPSTVNAPLNIPFSVSCNVGVANTIIQSGNLFPARPESYQYFNGSAFAQTSESSGNVVSASVTDLTDLGRGVVSVLNGDILSLQQLRFLANTTRFYSASLLDSFGSTFNANWQISYLLSAASQNETPIFNHKAIFVSMLYNSSGYFPLDNFTISYNGTSSCTTKYVSVVLASNATVTSAYCSVYVPDVLKLVNTTYAYNGTTTSPSPLGQTYYGWYDSATMVPWGLYPGDFGSVYFVVWDANRNVLTETLEGETCNENEVMISTSGENEVCLPKSCPLTTSIQYLNDSLGNIIKIRPVTYTCYSEGVSQCYVDSRTSHAFIVTCGNVCQAETRVCLTDACNSDASGCSDEKTLAQKQDTINDAFSQQPIVKFFFVDNPALLAGLIAAFVLAAGVYYLGKNVPMTAITFCSVALLSFILTMPGVAVVIIILIAVFVLFAFALFFIGGQRSPPGGG